MPGSARAVLWRKALLDPGWPTVADGGDARITMVDFSSELLGLSTLWLGADFFSTYSNHFEHDMLTRDPTRARQEARSANLA